MNDVRSQMLQRHFSRSIKFFLIVPILLLRLELNLKIELQDSIKKSKLKFQYLTNF